MKYTQISQYKEPVSHREGLIPMTYHLVDYEKNTMGFRCIGMRNLKSDL